jgi:hypothetical protein
MNEIHIGGKKIKRILFFGETGVLTQDLALAKQVLYHLSHTSSPFCSGYFGDEFLRAIFPGLASK